jgi:hypothetical protein
MNAELVIRATPPVSMQQSSRRLRKHVVHWLRRGHLYFGLFLFPWAILYGVTAFLFNHPTVFSDRPFVSFGRGELAGTAIESWPNPDSLADELMVHVHRSHPTSKRTGPARFNRSVAFATIKSEGISTNLRLDVVNGVGSLRSSEVKEKPKTDKAPFARGKPGEPRGRGRMTEPAAPSADGIALERKLADEFKAAVPIILERKGFPPGDVTVTSVPEVVFSIEAEGKCWQATYNPITGSLSGVPADSVEQQELSTRQLLLSFHVAHGYPGEMNAEWWWAVIVDAMAVIMCFWAFTGLVMWWQIKATRKAGLVVLILSAAAATALGITMYAAFKASN